jgi:hypothetical protein
VEGVYLGKYGPPPPGEGGSRNLGSITWRNIYERREEKKGENVKEKGRMSIKKWRENISEAKIKAKRVCKGE